MHITCEHDDIRRKRVYTVEIPDDMLVTLDLDEL